MLTANYASQGSSIVEVDEVDGVSMQGTYQVVVRA